MCRIHQESLKSRLHLTVSDNKILRNKIIDLEREVAKSSEKVKFALFFLSYTEKQPRGRE